MITIEYDATVKESIALPEGLVKSFVDNVINTHAKNKVDVAFVVGTELIIDEFRIAVSKKTIELEDIRFLFSGDSLVITKEGKFKYWPKGFCDYQSVALSQLCRY